MFGSLVALFVSQRISEKFGGRSSCEQFKEFVGRHRGEIFGVGMVLAAN